ncbi:MAG: hypothetical protein MAG581_01429 [Deltaproteobacteria bacterium]|jgi:hypothetical protein|nr:hypothetical protein [Deltaproteobacteria bacterium]
MIARKPQKFSLNSSESAHLNLPEGESSSFFNQQRKKTAADAATSILEELGVKKSSASERNVSTLGEVNRNAEHKKYQTKKHQDPESRILKDFKRQNTESKNLKSKNNDEVKMSKTGKTDTKKSSVQPNIKFGFHEKFILFIIFCVGAVATIAYIGGYLKFYDSAIFQHLAGNNAYHLEFAGEFKARKVENGYNRLPLLLVEGAIRNSFDESDEVHKIQLKAFAYNSENQIIESQFTFAGAVLTDNELETFSPMDITAIRHSANLEMLNTSEFADAQINNFNTELQQNTIPFQLIFFKSVQDIKRTSVQIVSYVRNNKIVFVRSSDLL